MMKFAICFLILGFILSVSACKYQYSSPSGIIEQGGTMLTSIYFEGAPVGARLMLDGADAGEVAAFDGSAAILAVAPGTHHIVVTMGGGIIYDQQVYVGSGSRVSVGIQ